LTDLKESKLASLSFILVKGYPKPWQEFWEPIHSLSRKLGIPIDAILETFRLVHECVSKEEEGRPVSTGFLIGDSEKLRQILPDSAGLDIPKQKIFELSKTVRSLFGLVDGVTSVFIIGTDGTLEDTRLAPRLSRVPDENCFITSELNWYSEILKGVPAYGLVALGPYKTAKLLHDGQLRAEVYFSGKVGGWAYRSLSEIREKLDQLAKEKGIDTKVLQKVFATTINMSNHRKGGTMIVGDSEEVLKQSEAPRHRIDGVNILDLKGSQEKHLYSLSTQEFALIMNSNGDLKASSVRLLAKVPDKAKVELTAMDGGRHRSAAEISAVSNSIAFVVSDDGPISVFSEGRRILRT